MTDTINISLRVQHNAEHPAQSVVLISASVDGVEMPPILGSGKLGRIEGLVRQFIEDSLIQARTAKTEAEAHIDQADSCALDDCKVVLPAETEGDTPSASVAKPVNDEPQLTLLNFG